MDSNTGDLRIMQASLVLLCLLCALSARTPDSDKTVRRLPVKNYPGLPSNVAAVLQSRRCTIPQPNQDGPARNVIRGEFFRKGNDHDGIDDAFLEKASVTWYWDNGRWMQLQGAD